MSAEPGRLNSLGQEEDLTDSQGLLDVVRACHDMRDRRTAGTSHIGRQALTSFWEIPRFPRPMIGQKYPIAFPWSEAARAVMMASPGTTTGNRGLVLEHVRPVNILVNTLIARANVMEAREVIGYLNRFMAFAVITRDEDARLTGAGVAFVPIDRDDPDPWARYRTAGLDVDGFCRLEDD